MARVIQAASQSQTDHWHCQCHRPCACSAAAVPLGLELESVLGGELACVVALILVKEAGRALADFSPSPHDLDEAHCCIVISVDFLVSPLFCLQMTVCGVEVSNLLLLPQGCKERGELGKGIGGFKDLVYLMKRTGNPKKSPRQSYLETLLVFRVVPDLTLPPFACVPCETSMLFMTV